VLSHFIPEILLQDVSQKQNTLLLLINLPDSDRFQNSFSSRLGSDCLIESSLKIPLHFNASLHHRVKP